MNNFRYLIGCLLALLINANIFDEQKNKKMRKIFFIIGIIATTFIGHSQKPIIQTKYTADPAPMYTTTHCSFTPAMMKTMQWALK